MLLPSYKEPKANMCLCLEMHRCSEVEVSRVEVLDWREEELRSAGQEQVDGARPEVKDDHNESSDDYGMGFIRSLEEKSCVLRRVLAISGMASVA